MAKARAKKKNFQMPSWAILGGLALVLLIVILLVGNGPTFRGSDQDFLFGGQQAAAASPSPAVTGTVAAQNSPAPQAPVTAPSNY